MRFLCDEWKVDIHQSFEEGEDGESFWTAGISEGGEVYGVRGGVVETRRKRGE